MRRGSSPGQIPRPLYRRRVRSPSVITLTWTFPRTALEFEFERMMPPDAQRKPSRRRPALMMTTMKASDWRATTTYLYRARAVEKDGEPCLWSDSEPSVIGPTLPFETTFSWAAKSRCDQWLKASNLVGVTSACMCGCN